MADAKSPELASAFLAGLRLDMRTVDELPAELVPPTLDAGYRVQASLVTRLCEARGGHPVGYKVALTSAMAQQLVGHPSPVFGRLLSHTCWRGPATLPAAWFTTRIIEAEFGFRFFEDVPEGQHDRDSIRAFVGELMPSIELVDHRFAGLDRMSAPVLAADNAIHGGWIEGDGVQDWRGIDLAAHDVSVRVNGAEVLTGAGDRVLGHPLEVLAWLANELPRHGLRLRAGDYVTTGLLTDGIVEAGPGDNVIADFGSFGQVTVDFT